MSVVVLNLTAGPGDLYYGDFEASEPAASAVGSPPASAAWTHVGGTQDGVNLEISQEYLVLEVDQIVDRAASRLQSREVMVKTNLAEPTLTMLGLVLNGGTVSASSGYTTYDPADDTAATQPTYKALLFHGWAPGENKRRMFLVRKVLSTESVESSYKKDGQTLFPVTFVGHYVSSTVKPFRVIDET
jgi:hypothetical protein